MSQATTRAHQKAHQKAHRRPRRSWTEDERATLTGLYPKATAGEIARLLDRTEKSVYFEAANLGLSKLERIQVDAGFLAEIRRLNGLDYPDGEIAETLGCDRHAVTGHRKKMGLESKARGSRYLSRVRANTAAQCAREGVSSLGEIRSLAFRRRSAAAGWPSDLRPRSVEILEALGSLGPCTRRELAEALGLPWRGSRQTLRSNDPEGTYLAHLINRGLVVDLGRVVRGPRFRKGGNCHLYSLSLEAERDWDRGYPQAAT